jgi:hypothetical protein
LAGATSSLVAAGSYAPSCHGAPPEEGDYMGDMEAAPAARLSPSEMRTLQQLAEGEFHVSEMDWVALQRLKRDGLAEERGRALVITQDGWRALNRMMPGGRSKSV